MSVNYPKDVPVAEIGEIVDIFRKGKVVEDKAEFAHKAWIVQGYIQLKVFGDPLDMSSIKRSDRCGTDDETFCGLLELEVAAEDETAVGGMTEAKGGFVPWGMLLKWFIKKILENLED